MAGYGYGGLFDKGGNGTGNGSNPGPYNSGGTVGNTTVGFGGNANYRTIEDYKKAKGYAASDPNQSFSNREQPPQPAKVSGDRGPLGLEVKAEPYTAQGDLRNWQYGGGPGFADAATQRYQTEGNFAGARGAYQLDPSQQNQARGFQSAAAVDAMRTMNGQNPSIAQRQMQLGLGQAQSNALGMAAGARGGGANQAAGMRAALAANNSMASQTNQQAGVEALRERESARNSLASVGGQMRGQDIGWQQGQGNLEMQQRGLNDATRLGFERLGADVQNQQLQASQNYGQTQMGAELQHRNQNFEAQKENRAGGIFGALGNIFSDEKVKKDVSDASDSDLDVSPYLGDEDQAKKDMASNPYMSMTPGGRGGDMVGDGNGKWGLDASNGAFDLAEARNSGGQDAGRQAMARMLKEGDLEEKKAEARNKAFQVSYEKGLSSDKKQDKLRNAGGVAGLLSMFSDKKVKKGVKGAKDSELKKFAQGMDAKTFRYKDEPSSAPKRAGVLAQDVEKSKLGKTVVSDTPAGKVLDVNKSLSLALASIAEMREELDELKGKGKKKKKPAEEK
jgi:hypothetical protein